MRDDIGNREVIAHQAITRNAGGEPVKAARPFPAQAVLDCWQSLILGQDKAVFGCHPEDRVQFIQHGMDQRVMLCAFSCAGGRDQRTMAVGQIGEDRGGIR